MQMDSTADQTIVRQSAVTLSEPAFTVLHAHLQIDLSSQQSKNSRIYLLCQIDNATTGEQQEEAEETTGTKLFLAARGNNKGYKQS